MSELQEFLNKSKLPENINFQDTFITVTSMTRREDLWTNIYAFLFDYNAQHGLKKTFINALIEIINSNIDIESIIELDNYSIKREVKTIKNGRIDLVIEDRGKTTLIIENKVDHELNNDLQDYYDSIQSKTKVGIVLSIKKYTKEELKEHFINITHKELIDKMYQSYINNKEKTQNKYTLLFEEFYKNVINESKIIDMEQVDFYLKNKEKINQIIKIKNQFDEHITNEIKSIENNYSQLFDFEYSKKRIIFLKNKSNPDLRISIVYGDLLDIEKDTNNDLYFIVELQNDLLNEFRKSYTFKNFDDFNFDDVEQNCLTNEYTKNVNNWGHFAVQYFQLEHSDIFNLSSFITRELNKSAVLNIYKKIISSSFFIDFSKSKKEVNNK